MDDQPICNSTRGHLGLQLEQPTRYIESPRDVESGAYPIVDDDEYDRGEEADNEEEENDDPDEEAGEAADTQTLQPESKVPRIYQVEPGCTPLSCYASIITFIIMVIGIVWLLVYSIPDNARHRPFNDTIASSDMVVVDMFNSVTTSLQTEVVSDVESDVVSDAGSDTIEDGAEYLQSSSTDVDSSSNASSPYVDNSIPVSSTYS